MSQGASDLFPGGVRGRRGAVGVCRVGSDDPGSRRVYLGWKDESGTVAVSRGLRCDGGRKGKGRRGGQRVRSRDGGFILLKLSEKSPEGLGIVDGVGRHVCHVTPVSVHRGRVGGSTTGEMDRGLSGMVDKKRCAGEGVVYRTQPDLTVVDVGKYSGILLFHRYRKLTPSTPCPTHPVGVSVCRRVTGRPDLHCLGHKFTVEFYVSLRDEEGQERYPSIEVKSLPL